MNKCIWIINEYAGSPYHGMEFRHYYLGKQLISLGYKVIIISGSYSHLFRKFPECNKIINYENIDGIDYFWIKVINYGVSTNKKRVLKWLQFSLQLIFLNFKKIQKPDYILLSPMATFSVIPSYLLAKQKKAKYIIEIKDIWPLSITELGGYSMKNPFVMMLRLFELFGLRYSNVIISNLPNYGQYLEENGIGRGFHYIPNGIDLDEKNNKEDISEEIKRVIPKGKFIVGYAGTIGLANGLENLIEVAELLKYDQKIYFVIVGEGKNKKELISKANSLNNILFLPAIPKKQIQSLLSYFDICFIGWRNKNIYKYGVAANKIFDYMYAEKPILQAIDSKFNIIDQAICGICVESENPRKIADAILELYTMPDEKRNKLGKNGKEYVLKYHTYDVLAKQLKEVLDGLESSTI